MAYRVDLRIGPARMICVTSEVLSARSVDRPTAVDLEEITVASGLKFIGLLGRKLAAFVFDNERSLLDRRCRKKAKTGAGTADAESSRACHISACTTICACATTSGLPIDPGWPQVLEHQDPLPYPPRASRSRNGEGFFFVV